MKIIVIIIIIVVIVIIIMCFATPWLDTLLYTSRHGQNEIVDVCL